MEEFFKQFPVKLSEKIALKMMHDQLECAKEKLKEKNEMYLVDLQKLHQMIEVFLTEKESEG